MNRWSTEPEFILEKPLEEMHRFIARSNNSSTDWDQAWVDLVELSEQVNLLTDISVKIHTDMVRLVQSLQVRE